MACNLLRWSIYTRQLLELRNLFWLRLIGCVNLCVLIPLNDRPHTYLWLAKTYAVPAGMYASQVWGTPFMKQDAVFESVGQKCHLNFLKGILGVKRTTCNWAVLRECGHEALQFYWFRAAIKFYNCMLCSNSEIVREYFTLTVFYTPGRSVAGLPN